MKKINYGIEAGRILTMTMIMILHILKQGGLLDSVPLFTIKGQSLILLEYLSIIAVNIFALITGYVMINGKYRPKRLVGLWLQVLFYSYAMILVVMPIRKISMKSLITSLFPTLFNEYWYFNSYLILFLFIPLINKAIKNFTRLQLIKVILFMLVVLSVLSSFTGREQLYVDGGYSPIWLMYMYIIGAFINLYGNIIKLKIRSLYLYIFFAVVMVILHDILNYFVFNLSDKSEQSWILLRFSFPIVLVMAIILFQWLLQLEFSKKIESIITFFSKHSFAAYLFQTNTLFFTYILKDSFVRFSVLNTFSLILLVLVSSLIFYLIAVLMDKLRVVLFRTIYLEDFVYSQLYIISNRILKVLRI